ASTAAAATGRPGQPTSAASSPSAPSAAARTPAPRVMGPHGSRLRRIKLTINGTDRLDQANSAAQRLLRNDFSARAGGSVGAGPSTIAGAPSAAAPTQLNSAATTTCPALRTIASALAFAWCPQNASPPSA